MIPKVIHQIWIGSLKEPNFWSNTWSQQYLELNPEYKYKLWNNDNSNILFEKYPILKKFFTSLKGYAYKADILRLIILYEYGGIYIDIDSVWLNSKSLNTLIDKSKDTNLFVGKTPNHESNSKYYITNGVIGSLKGHELIKNCISKLEEYIYNYSTKSYDTKLIIKRNLERSSIVGPGLLTKEFKNQKVTIFESEYFYPCLWHNININEIDYKKHFNSYMFQFGFSTNKLSPNSKYTFYWINLDRNLERRTHMYELFSKKLFYNKRIIAYDGNKLDQYPELKYNGFKNISKYEYGCTFSHLKSIKTCFDNNDSIGIICEDDLCLDYMSKWNLGIDEIMNVAPSDWEIIKIHCNYTKHIKKLLKRKNRIGNFSPWEMRSVSTLGYIINRSGMKKIINKFFINEKFTLTDEISSKADILIYQNANTYDYTSPLLNHLCTKSEINSNHENTHKEGSDFIYEYFKKK